MSRSYRKNRRNNVKKSFMTKTLRCWGDDFEHKKKNRDQGRIIRARLKRETMREAKDYER